MKKAVLRLMLICITVHHLYAQTEEAQFDGLKSDVPGHSRPSLGYKPAPFRINSTPRSPGDMRYKSSAALPSRFDLRDEGRVTSAKDQGGGSYGGNCTSFSSIGSIESRWLSMGLPETDLSEQNMAACNGFDEENWGYGKGANQFVCSAYLTRFEGPVLEAEDPYNPFVPLCRDYPETVALVPESRWLPVRDFDRLKHTVYYYGAVYAGIYWDVTGASFRSEDNTYHYNGIEPPNHAILVCGWDDDKVTAGGTGAWICKNSWGTGWGENGFFYISYQDSKFAGDEVAFFPVRWEKEDVDTSYFWDELGFTAKLPVTKSTRVHELAMFTAPSQQLVTHVGACVPDPESVLDFRIYGDFTGGELGNLLASREGIYVEVPGIYTFELPVKVEGDFYIEVSREIGDGEISYPVETFDEGFSDPVFNPDVNWIRRDWEEEWIPTDQTEIYTGEFNLTIRAYAVYGTAPVALFKADKTEACLGSEVTYTYLENHTASSFSWDFGEGASPATAGTQGPHQVTYSTEGTKSVSLVVSGPGGTDTIVRHDYIDVVPAIRVNLLNTSRSFQQGKTVGITAYGADSYQWSPSNMVDNDGLQTVQVTPPNAGTHMLYVTGSQGSCTAMDSIELTTFPKPPNDDMCNARLISDGEFVNPVYNGYATAEAGEPAPEDIDCYGSLTWCDDTWGPTVTHSLWYYFYGPATGNASIYTTGFDNQIAVYRSDTCDGIVLENLVAANDDPSAAELAARIKNISVVPGAKYYLQVDGSHGGDTGQFSLLMVGWPAGIEGPGTLDPSAPRLLVYPNPGRDIFNIRLENALSSRVDVMLYDLNGRLVLRKSFGGVPGELFARLDLSRQSSGVYHLRIREGDRILERKLVKY